MSKPVMIPALVPYPKAQADLGQYVSSQPILQFKELEVDRVRYDAWKANIARTKPNKKR